MDLLNCDVDFSCFCLLKRVKKHGYDWRDYFRESIACRWNKEKILAAKRANIKEIILCHENKSDIDEIKPEYKAYFT
jgi:hypothetical protein